MTRSGNLRQRANDRNRRLREKLAFMRQQAAARKLRMQEIDNDVDREVRRVNQYLVANLGQMYR